MPLQSAALQNQGELPGHVRCALCGKVVLPNGETAKSNHKKPMVGRLVESAIARTNEFRSASALFFQAFSKSRIPQDSISQPDFPSTHWAAPESRWSRQRAQAQSVLTSEQPCRLLVGWNLSVAR